MHWRKSCECQQNITGTPWFWLRIRPAVGTQWPSRNLVNIDVEKWSISRWFTVTVEFAYQYRIQSLLPSGGCLNPIKPLLNHSPGRCEHCGNRVQKVCIYTVVHSTYMYTICSNIHIWYSINIHIIMFVRIYIYICVTYMDMSWCCVHEHVSYLCVCVPSRAWRVFLLFAQKKWDTQAVQQPPALFMQEWNHSEGKEETEGRPLRHEVKEISYGKSMKWWDSLTIIYRYILGIIVGHHVMGIHWG